MQSRRVSLMDGNLDVKPKVSADPSEVDLGGGRCCRLSEMTTT